MKILIDTSPLDTGHAIRGIGAYTRLLVQFLEELNDHQIVRSGTQEADQFQPDLIHYPYFDLFFSTLPMVRRQPTVVTVHDVIPLKFPEHYPPGIKGKAKFIKQKAALKTVQAVITDSAASKSDIIEHLGVDQDRIHVIQLAANPALKYASEDEVRSVKRKYQLPKNYVLYVGDINYNKNIPQLIKAVRYLPRHTKLVCVGQGFQEQEIPEWQWIETQLALSDVADKVKFVPDLQSGETDELSAFYTGALCYIQPSLYEGFGLPVLEAMQCMTPVVATNTSSLIEVGGEHAVFTETDAESIAQGVEKVLSWSKTKRAEKVRAAYQWSQQFSWLKTAKQTMKVYQQVLTP